MEMLSTSEGNLLVVAFKMVSIGEQGYIRVGGVRSLATIVAIWKEKLVVQHHNIVWVVPLGFPTAVQILFFLKLPATDTASRK